ncbi:MAG TPA: hypothetical protein VFQ96_04240 [Microbacteriaceae bacterium]|nr:hypothetical protein [Microbacteriaceae bacterium]
MVAAEANTLAGGASLGRVSVADAWRARRAAQLGMCLFVGDIRGDLVRVTMARVRGRVGRRPAAPKGRRWVWWLIVAVIVATAFTARLLYLLHTGGLLQARNYDDGVYYAATDAFVHGRLPYRDFLLLQPPGVIFAAAPAAWLGSLVGDPVGLITGRLLFIAAGAVNAGLVAVILRRFGYAAAAFGGFFYALDFMAIYTERSLLLEPFGTLCILVGLALQGRVSHSDAPPGTKAAGVDRAGVVSTGWASWLRAPERWLVIAGIVLGFSTSFRIWNIVPAVVIVLFTRGARRRVRLLVGVVVGALVCYLPFFVFAPSTMFREIVTDQMGRPRVHQSILHKLHIILGDAITPGFGLSTRKLIYVLLVLAILAVVVALAVRDSRLYVALFFSGLAVLLLSPSFFPHYTALTNPALALILGVAFGRLCALLRPRAGRVALTVVAIAGILVVYLPAELRGAQPAPPARGLQAAAASVDGCVLADDPTILAVMNVLSRDLKAGCPLWPDVTGWTYDADKVTEDGVAVARAKNAVWQKAAVDYLLSGSAVIQYRAGTGLDAASAAEIRRGRVLFHDGIWTLYATPQPAVER